MTLSHNAELQYRVRQLLNHLDEEKIIDNQDLNLTDLVDDAVDAWIAAGVEVL